MGCPVALSMSSTLMGASHFALRTSFTRYLGEKLTEQRRWGLCSHSTHCASRQPRLLQAMWRGVGGRGVGAKARGPAGEAGQGGDDYWIAAAVGTAAGRRQQQQQQPLAPPVLPAAACASHTTPLPTTHRQSWRKTSCRSRCSSATPL